MNQILFITLLCVSLICNIALVISLIVSNGKNIEVSDRLPKTETVQSYVMQLGNELGKYIKIDKENGTISITVRKK